MLFFKNNPGKSGNHGFVLESLLFDLDGTLIDSVATYYVMMETVFQRLHWPRVSREVMRSAIRDGGFDWGLILPTGTARTQEDLIASARVVIREMYPRVFEEDVDLVPGAESLLKKLYDRNVKLGLVTSTLGRFIEFKLIPLKKRGLRDLFQSIITLDDVKNRKPSGDPLLECARRLGENPETCAYVGDTTVDIVAGKAAGMRTIAVLTGVDDSEALRREDPDMILASVSELAEHLGL